jgi:hypothetical protein
MSQEANLASSPISEAVFHDAVEYHHHNDDILGSVSTTGKEPIGDVPLSAQQEHTPLAPPNTTDSRGQNLTWHTWEDAFEYIKSEGFRNGYIIVKGRTAKRDRNNQPYKRYFDCEYSGTKKPNNKPSQSGQVRPNSRPRNLNCPFSRPTIW